MQSWAYTQPVPKEQLRSRNHLPPPQKSYSSGSATNAHFKSFYDLAYAKFITDLCGGYEGEQ